MTIKREVIAAGLALSTHEDRPGHLCVTVHDYDAGGFPRFRILTPGEVDNLVLYALSMTKPGDLDHNAEEDYEAAMDAVRVWQSTRATRESVRRRDAERDQILKDAGFSLPYWNSAPAVQFLVDQLIEARKAGQK